MFFIQTQIDVLYTNTNRCSLYKHVDSYLSLSIDD